VNAPSLAIPNSDTAIPKWAITMPHVATGTRVSLRPRKQCELAEETHQPDHTDQNGGEQQHFKPDAAGAVLLPPQQRADRHHQEHRNREHRARRVEIGRADRHPHIKRLSQQRVERAE